MKKVAFSISNVRSKSDKKLSGFGYLSEGNLLCPCISKNNKPFIRVFDDVEKACRPIKDRSNEFKGYITMYFTPDSHFCTDCRETESFSANAS